MTRENNFLIGNGEKLTSKVKVPTGGGAKNPPYTFNEAREKLADQLYGANDFYIRLDDKAKPKNQVVAKLTLHPRYVSKSDYPKEMLDSLGLRAVGSKSEKISPKKWGIKKPPEFAITESYFIAGLERDFEKWFSLLDAGDVGKALEKIVTIEKLSAISGQEKLKGIVKEDQHSFEIVLHNDHDKDITELFLDYVNDVHGEINKNKIRVVDGLTFIPIMADSIEIVQKISDFSFVRVARGMPSLRPYRPMIRGADLLGKELILPSTPIIDTSIKTVIFDGGLEKPERLSSFVNYIEPIGIGKPYKNYLDHGLAVTGAYLFGNILESNIELSAPIASVDHVRVLDEESGEDGFEIIDVLDRISEHLLNNDYDLANISLGPDLSVEDDEVTLWTATLDNIFSKGNCVATVAVGNNGKRDADSGLNRIQVPADAVNVLSVGATNINGDEWKRADYSAFGPGRCPGRTKPDLMAFGGSREEPFQVLSMNGGELDIDGQCGTSYAAPLTLRSIAGLKAVLGKDVSHLSLRALMIHHSYKGSHKLSEVGWGKAELEPTDLITSDDCEATVLFQGELVVGEHLRIPVPLQDLLLNGDVNIKATLVICPEVDIEFPGAYTRHGVEVVFRPNDMNFSIDKKTGKKSEHPKSATFFTNSEMFKGPEYKNREEGNKWEPILRHEQKFDAKKLSNPVFDVYYHYREGAQVAVGQKPIPYSLIITVRAEEVFDLYNKVIRRYASILAPFRVQNRVTLSPKNN